MSRSHYSLPTTGEPNMSEWVLCYSKRCKMVSKLLAVSPTLSCVISWYLGVWHEIY